VRQWSDLGRGQWNSPTARPVGVGRPSAGHRFQRGRGGVRPIVALAQAPSWGLTAMTMPSDERRRRWLLALGARDRWPSERDARMDRGAGGPLRCSGAERSGPSGAAPRRAAPRVSRWLGDIREFFRPPVVQVIQRDAFDAWAQGAADGAEFLATLEADVHLVADIVSLRAAMPEKAKDTAAAGGAQVVDELMKSSRTRPRRRSAARRPRAATNRRVCRISTGRAPSGRTSTTISRSCTPSSLSAPSVYRRHSKSRGGHWTM